MYLYFICKLFFYLVYKHFLSLKKKELHFSRLVILIGIVSMQTVKFGLYGNLLP